MNVLITRPDERGQALAEMLNNAHIFAIHQPLFQIEAGRELPQLPSVLSQLNAGDMVFAVSKHAVDYACDTLRQTGFHWRKELCYFAVGQKSAHYFCANAEQNVRFPLDSENSEGVLALPEMQDLNGKTLLILRAETGRNLLAETAQTRGAQVQYLECYQRIPLTENMPEQLSLAKRAGIDTIVATSGDILTALVEQTHEDDHQWLFECRLVVVGKRLAGLAKQLGWRGEIWLSPKADNQSLFTLLQPR